MNSREAFRRTMQAANPGRPVFVPIVYRLAARIEQMPLADMVADPTSYANVLEGASKLLRSDAIVTNFDPSLEAEIFGCRADWEGDYDLPAAPDWAECDLADASLENSGRVPVMLEAIKRLIQTRGREVAIIGGITGPCSLARNIAGEASQDMDYIISMAGAQLARLTRAIGEVKVDAIIIREDLLAERYYVELLAHEKAYTAVYATLLNLTRFYNMTGIIMVKAQKMKDLAELGKKLGPGGFILSGQKLNQTDLAYLKDLSASQKLAVGLPLTLEDPEVVTGQLKTYEDFINQYQPGGFFYTTDGEVPPGISLETVHATVSRIKGD